jgi:hypothetical protein
MAACQAHIHALSNSTTPLSAIMSMVIVPRFQFVRVQIGWFADLV